jgi:hypothetical protein
MITDRTRRRLAPWIGSICIVVIFASVLIGHDRLAFRDVGYFYTPLYQFVDAQCERQAYGPLGNAIWNEHDQMGMPLAGETTTAVFYPLRVLVYAPSWSAETAMAVYVVLHLIIASLTAYYAARCFRCDRWSASIASIVYPLSGMVLFLATNPPFLVGAAWLPLLLTSLLRISVTSILSASIAMSLTILGGDPPTALHALLVAGVIHFFNAALNISFRGTDAIKDLLRSGGQIIAVVLIATALSAPQIAASLAWSSCSDRVQHTDATTQANVFKIRSQAFAYSVAPSRLAEFCIPNLYGTPWPINTRWDRLWFDSGQVQPETALWTPTLYSGLCLPVLLVLGGLPCSRSRRYSCMLWWAIFGIGIVTSMGVYGPTFGLLYEYVPGYDSLRYPSKWLPFAAVAFAMLSAITVQRQQALYRYRIRFPLVDKARDWPQFAVCAIAVSTTLACAASALIGIPRLRGVISDPFWGPFQPAIAYHGLLVSITHLVFAAGVLVLLRKTRWFVVVVAVELLVAHGGLVPRVNRQAESQMLHTYNSMENDLPVDEPESSRLQWLRVNQDGTFPRQWATTSDVNRMLTVEAGLRHARFGRWHLEHDQAVVNPMVSIGTREMAEFWYYSRQLSHAEKLPYARSWRGWCNFLGVDGYLRCGSGNNTTSPLPSQVKLPFVTYERFQQHVDSPLTVHQHGIALDDDRAGAWRQVLLAYAEQPEPPAFISKEILSQLNVTENRRDQRVVVSRRVYQDGYWQAMLTPRHGSGPAIAAEVFPVDFLSQGVLCPTGQWQIDFFYAPWWHRPMIFMAILTWAVVVAICCYMRVQSLDNR